MRHSRGQLIRSAEIAYGARHYAALHALGRAMLAIPCKPAQTAARYSRAVLLKRAGQIERATRLA